MAGPRLGINYYSFLLVRGTLRQEYPLLSEYMRNVFEGGGQGCETRTVRRVTRHPCGGMKGNKIPKLGGGSGQRAVMSGR